MSAPQAYEAQIASYVERWSRENDVDEAQARRMPEPELLSSGAGMVVPWELMVAVTPPPAWDAVYRTFLGLGYTFHSSEV
ncbi:hypothetical protein [Streptomyces tsukubensis]|uniref:hypothetical protein n=1 Tax=Streptomyces tsukubensis TaxID=83656 RepID=UPI00344D909E